MVTSPSAARGQAVRARLLAAAAELIPERGWAAVSTRVLAERAGVTPSVVHYHFPSLQALLAEAVVGGMRRMLADLDGLLTSSPTPADAVEAVEAMVQSVDRYTGADSMSLLFIEAYLAATRDERLREQIAGVVAEFQQPFAVWLADQGVSDPEETALVLAASIDGLLLHRGLGAHPDAERVAGVLRRLVSDAKATE